MRWFKEVVKFFAPCGENGFRPPFLESGLLIFVVGLFLTLKIINVSLLFYLPKTDLFADITKSEILKLTNQERQRMGLYEVRINTQLERAAYKKARDMLQNGYFSHTSPIGLNPWYWIQNAGYNYKYAGENLAIGFLESSELFSAWYASASHRDNIISANYSEIGIAVVKGNFRGAETTLVVQLFGSRAQSIQKAKPLVVAQNAGKQESSTPTTAIILGEQEVPQESGLENTPEEEQEMLYQEILLSPSQKPSFNANLGIISGSFVRFMATDYSRVVEKVAAGFIIFLIVVFGAAFFAQPNFQNNAVMLKTMTIIIFLAALLAADAKFIVSLMPHNPLI